MIASFTGEGGVGANKPPFPTGLPHDVYVACQRQRAAPDLGAMPQGQPHMLV